MSTVYDEKLKQNPLLIRKLEKQLEENIPLHKLIKELLETEN